MKILFVCKYNRFRSRVAEAYFKKINPNKNIKVKSAGLIVGKYPLDRTEVSVAKSLGIKLVGRPQPITTALLKWEDMIVLVANNVPKSFFKFNKKYGKKVIVWKIPDIKSGENGKVIKKIILSIMKKVDKLVKELGEER